MAPPKKSKPFLPGEPAVRAVNRATTTLPSKIQQLEAPGAIMRPDHAAVFTIIRRTVGDPAKRFAQFAKAYTDIGDMVTTVLKAHGRDPQVLGSSSSAEVAQRLMGLLASMNIKARNLGKFEGSVRGYRGNVSGEVFHWQVEADRNLAARVMQWSMSATQDINDVALGLHGKTAAQIAPLHDRIVDAGGKVVVLPANGSFGAPLVASNIYVVLQRDTLRNKKYIDAATVSLYAVKDAPPSHFTFPTQGEYKFNFAIQKAAKQILNAPDRLTAANVKSINFTAGGKDYAFKPGKAVFLAGKTVAPEALKLPFSGPGRPDMNQYVVTNRSSLVEDLGRKEAFSSSLNVLLSGDEGAPQVSPALARNNQASTPAVVVEVAIDSRFVLNLVDVLLGRQ